MNDELRVRFSETGSRGRFELLGEGGAVLGRMTFSRAADDLVIVDHTEVDGSLRGKGAGRMLFSEMVRWARRTETRVRATCPFTLSMFERDPESRDVLDDDRRADQ
ncbi:MAG TPA: GNAT family N-acetyltransferase [Sandaracinaceae bacterium]